MGCLLAQRPLMPPAALLDARDAPLSSCRSFPDEVGQQFDSSGPAAGEFACRSTADCYADFPKQVHMSVPLPGAVEDREPAGLTAQRIADAGPATGRRRCAGRLPAPTPRSRQIAHAPRPGLRPLCRRPAPVDSSGREEAPSPLAQDDLQRQLLVRRALLLKQGPPAA